MSKKQVIVVSNSENGSAINHSLRNNDYVYLTSSSRGESLKILSDYNSSNILLDVNLPGLNWTDSDDVLQKTSQKLTDSEKYAKILFDSSIDAIILVNESGQIQSVNPAFSTIFEYSTSEILHKNIQILIPIIQTEWLVNLKKNTDAIIKGQSEVVAVKKNQSIFDAEVRVGIGKVNNQVIYIFTIIDITERKRNLQALEYLAHHDSLTGLPNRTYLYKHFYQWVEKYRNTYVNFSLLIFDVDNFKNINDTLGHHYGDLLLQELSERIKSSLENGEFLSRLGGDEFAVIFEIKNQNEIISTIKKILNTLKHPFHLDDQLINVEISMGVSIYPLHGEDVSSLFRNADIAMYSSKKEDRNYTIYSKTQDNSYSLEELSLVGDLRRAIEEKELRLNFQPKFEMISKKVKSVEALARWKHPEKGYISPGLFIPLAEQNGLIKALTYYVLEEAIKQIHVWQNENFHVKVSVNISRSNLQDFTLPEQIQSILNKYGVGSSNLIIEITESSIMSNLKNAVSIINRINEMGIGISIDDFGTGYSSLVHLKQLPINEIKIDKSFVMDMLQDKNDEVIVKSIINLSHSLGLRVVAEGVETKGIFEKLQQFNCDEAQGFYLYRPLSPSSLLEKLEKH